MIALVLAGCTKYESSGEMTKVEESTSESGVEVRTEVTEGAAPTKAEVISISSYPPGNPVKVEGTYISAYVAGTGDMMDRIIEGIDRTELNVVVIDVKDGQGRITFTMGSPTVNKIGACQPFISDLPGLVRKLNEHDIYPIARVDAFRDLYLIEQKPEQNLHVEDGSIYQDSEGLVRVNPYRQGVRDYLVEIGKEAEETGLKEIQFDYIRFVVDRTTKSVVFDKMDTKGRDKTQAVVEFVSYAYDELAKEGLFASANVFGITVRSEGGATAVRQEYEDMAEHLDYVYPMIYPSHYGPGNSGIENPDKQPYDTIRHALKDSIELLVESRQEYRKQAVVRPWFQDFTISYLKDYMNYGDQEMHQQIQTAYDSGCDEWILWDADVSYRYGGLLTPEKAAAKEQAIEESRISKAPENTGLPDTETQGPESGPSQDPMAR